MDELNKNNTPDDDFDDTEEEASEGWTWKSRFGCIGGLIYLGMSFFEMFAIYDWLVFRFDIHAFFAFFSSLLLCFIPGLASLLAYWGATEAWGWESLSALIAFFWYYAPIAVYVLVIMLTLAFALLMAVFGKWFR